MDQSGRTWRVVMEVTSVIQALVILLLVTQLISSR
jgi:hypothetical protein